MTSKKKPSLKSILSDAGVKKVKRRKSNGEPLWDLYRDGVSISAMTKFLGCRERFRLASVEGWTAKGLAVPLEFGTIFHNLLEIHYAGGSKAKYVKSVSDYISNKIKSCKASTEDVERLGWMTLEVFLGYLEHWKVNPTYTINGKDYFDRDMDHIYQEQWFEVEHFVPQRNRSIRLVGIIDGGFRVPWDKSLALLENKTKGKYDVNALIMCMQEDLQCMTYAYMLRRSVGEEPKKILYNLIRRPQLHLRKNETVKSYVERLRDDIKKRPEFYYDRIDVDLEKDDVEKFVVGTLNKVLTQMIDWWESIKHDPFNPWVLENGEDNELHFRKPMGVYDSEAFSVRGELSEIIFENDYSGYYQDTRRLDRAKRKEQDGNSQKSNKGKTTNRKKQAVKN